ncbi:hypothetical protein AHAS_Ahas10G0149200 [Arachis hypogaea]
MHGVISLQLCRRRFNPFAATPLPWMATSSSDRPEPFPTNAPNVDPGSVISLSNLDDSDSSKYLVWKKVQESLENLKEEAVVPKSAGKWDLPTESETVIPYVHSMKQAHKILRTVISPRLICSKLLRYLQQLQLGQWQLTILGWPQIRILPWHYYL